MLSEPLSVTSCPSTEGGSASTSARVIRLAEPVTPVFMARRPASIRAFRRSSVTAPRVVLSGVAVPGGGKISNPTSPRSWPADHHVLHMARQSLQHIHAQIAGLHPGAGVQLEIFGHAAIEIRPWFMSSGSTEAHRIASDEKAFLVKGLRGLSGSLK